MNSAQEIVLMAACIAALSFFFGYALSRWLNFRKLPGEPLTPEIIHKALADEAQLIKDEASAPWIEMNRGLARIYKRNPERWQTKGN